MKKVLSVIFILTFAVSATVAAVFAAKSSIMIECNSYSIESYSFDPVARFAEEKILGFLRLQIK